jgi:hypothetical protein
MGNRGIFLRSFLREKAHGAIYDLGEIYGGLYRNCIFTAIYDYIKKVKIDLKNKYFQFFILINIFAVRVILVDL